MINKCNCNYQGSNYFKSAQEQFLFLEFRGGHLFKFSLYYMFYVHIYKNVIHMLTLTCRPLYLMGNRVFVSAST